jgi:D-alanine-D-alanine ligase
MKVGVLMGGWSPEKSVSLMSGKNVVEGLKKAGVKAVALTLTGADKKERRLEKRVKGGRFDAVFIALHGTFGEDGQLQALLDKWKVAYTGSGALACGLAMHKGCSKLVFEAKELPTAPWVAVHRSTSPSAWGKGVKFQLPWVVKPADSGSAIGVTIVRDKKAFSKAVRLAFRYSEWAVVERFVAGTEVTVAVLGEKALPVIEILPVNEFYDFDSKYTPGHSAHIIPARVPASVRAKAQSLSLKAGKALGCEDYYRVDLIVPSKGEPQILEVNTAPGMTATSLVPDAARAAGLAFPALLKRICQMALKRGGRKG